MIPARLALRNFLSYADASPPLELEGIGFACLCGENGHGKSTLIDAITWALWGRARGRDLDALIHHGRRDMEVDFEFLAGEARYRVVRRRQRVGARGAGRPGLEFQVRQGEEWRPLTEPTVAQTEAAIERTLRLSYETFVNSALLLQGKADLFTAAGPANRKKVLAEILELGRYGALEERAREARRARQQEIAQLDAALAEIAPRIAALPALEEELARTERERQDAQRAYEMMAGTLESLRAAQATLDRQREELHGAQAAVLSERATLESAERQRDALAGLVAADEPIAAVERAIRAGYERLRAARTAEREWVERLQRLRAIDEQSQPLQQQIARAEAELRQRAALLRLQCDEARRAAAKRPAAEQQLAILVSRAEKPELTRAESDGPAAERRAILDRIARLTAENQQIARERQARHETLAGLDGVTDAATCPLCRGPLAPAGLEQMRVALHEEEQTARQRQDANSVEIRDAERRATVLGRAAAERQHRLDQERTELSERLAAARLALEQARDAQERLSRLSRERDEAAARLSAGDCARESRAALRGLLEEREALGYSARRHRDASTRAEAAQQYEVRHQQLLQALARLEANRPALAHQQRTVAECRARLAAAEERGRLLADTVAALPDVSGRLAEVQTGLAEITSRRAALDQQLGRLTAQVEECRTLRAIHAVRQTRLAAVCAEEQIYADLATAFGRKGVQAFIIDAVLPEVEDEANRLLGRMTNGRMRLRLETQRETRAGDLAETLEIAIADEWGTRDYDMYSGGEAFRIDLALRVALSRLLARRTGAPLPTLIVDEGFGSLDASGRDLIVDAVSSIRDDFQCLLVVTHIEELKQRFDTRIEVDKGERGSIARVVRV